MAKYTKEEKQKAIDLYIKYCKRTTRVIKELGYPNERHTLVSWYREYEENGRVKDDGRKEKSLKKWPKQLRSLSYLSYKSLISKIIS